MGIPVGSPCGIAAGTATIPRSSSRAPSTHAVVEQIDDTTSRISTQEIVAYLRDRLGQRVTAYLVGAADPKQIAAYARGGNVSDVRARRLREGFKVVRMIETPYDTETAKAWLFGTNARLDDQAPIELIAGATKTPSSSPTCAAPRASSPAQRHRRLDLAAQTLWRVGHRRDPLRFAPRNTYEWSHRFDDLHRRWRTVYCAWTPEAALREVLADLRRTSRRSRGTSSATGRRPPRSCRASRSRDRGAVATCSRPSASSCRAARGPRPHRRARVPSARSAPRVAARRAPHGPPGPP